jgi:hypothetical protein
VKKIARMPRNANDLPHNPVKIIHIKIVNAPTTPRPAAPKPAAKPAPKPANQ